MTRFCSLAAGMVAAVLPWTASGAINAAPQTDFEKVLTPFLEEHCNRCHGERKQKGEFRLDTLSRDFTSGADAGHWADVLERISAAEMPPEEEEKQPSSQEAARVVEWLSAKLKEGETARLAKREHVSFHRLTRNEYVNTVRDLLGVNYDAADPSGLSEDEHWSGFERIGTVLSLSPSHVEKYLAAAESILAEALPAKPPQHFVRRKTALELRGRKEDYTEPMASRVRVDMWPGHAIEGGRPGPGQSLPAAGDYRVRIQVSGLKPKNGRAPHLALYAVDLDRMLFEQDIVAPEEKPTIVEFTTHLPAGNLNFRLSNEVPGPSNLPRSGRADPRIAFFSTKDGRRPWQMKLTDETGEPLWPFLIVDWVEWEGPLGADGPTYAQREYMPKESGNMGQMRESLGRFAERAFRRPVSVEEVERFAHLVESEVANGETFDTAIRAGFMAVLCSKNFLYLVEGEKGRAGQELNDWELASRLSYFLWSTMPDPALCEAVRSGKLRHPEVLRAQVQRMVRDPKAVRLSESFSREWLQLRQVGTFPPDKKLYPDYDSYLEKSMIAETTSYFREVLEKNLSLREFVDSDWTMVNARLAWHYGLPNVTEDRFQRVALRAEDHRGGLLTQAAILSLTSDGTRHRPVHRGKWILESIIGKPPPPPPANVKPIEPTPATQPKATLRMKLDAHKSDANCAACHRKIDPLGLAFDNYDAIGRWRTEEAVNDGQGENPNVEASGELPDGRRFTDAASFKRLLLEDMDKFNAAFIEKLATFALRRVMTFDDRDELHVLTAQSKLNDYRLGDIVEALVLSDLFLKR